MVKAYGFDEFGGPEVASIREIDMPVPMAGELLVQVRAAGVVIHQRVSRGAARRRCPRS